MSRRVHRNNHENLSYFGNGNEAHWVYNFSLPPLVLNSLLFADSEALRSWSMSMPLALEGTSYLNFLSSHDGFGMRPTEGILTESQRSLLLNRLEANGSLFTWRHVITERKSIYEANITLFSALEKTDDDPTGIYQIERFIAAHTILFCLEGIPALYINNLLGSRNDTPGAKKSGINRRINREKFSMEWVRNCFEDSGSKESLLFSELKRLLKLRAQQAAFHPNATQFTLQLGSHLFGVWRQSSNRKQSIFAITNLLSDDVILDLSEINLINTESWMDLIQNKKFEIGKRRLRLEAYQSVWITNNA
jgi:sucrose phosphorylase